MDEHFRAFTFVDQFTGVQPGVHISGRYAIPAGIKEFPGSLVAEATGQLAAWAAMQAVDFRYRPVAGIAGQIDLLATVRPGQTLDLVADLEMVDAETVAYSGAACVNGTPVIRLQDCVGPMVPMEGYDDPQLVRERFSLLAGAGATPGGFAGLPPLALEQLELEGAQSARARFRVPASSALFADHFPRRPVFPGSLLMHMNLQLAAKLSETIPVPTSGQRWTLRAVSDVKLRTFIPPAESLSLEARVSSSSGDSLVLRVETRNARRVLAEATVHLRPEGQP